MIRTHRLHLLPARTELLLAELEAREALERALGIPVPPDWPPELYDRDAVQYILDRIAEDPTGAGWWLHYIVLVAGDDPVVVGTAGYKGPPDAGGTVEVGYSVLSAFRRRGIATEATRGLVARAFRHPGVRCVIAETLPHLTPSIGVMEKCGFRYAGAGSEAGVIRYALTRAVFERAGG